MKKVIPTVFSTNKAEFEERFRKLKKISKNLQIDFMDGKFVKTKSVKINDIPKVSRDIEAHLMVRDVRKWADIGIAKGFGKIIFHVESVDKDEAEEIARAIKKKGKKAFIALNPETKLERVEDFVKAETIDGILLLGVHPGKEGQALDRRVFDKIKKLKKINKKIIVQIDGGVNAENAAALSSAGADIINSGSFVARADNPKRALALLRKKFS